MKYVIFTFSGEGLPIAEKLKAEGQSVTVAQIADEKNTVLPEDIDSFEPEDADTKKVRISLYDGVIKKYDADLVAKQLLKVKHKEDYFLFFDFNHAFQYAEKLQDAGFKGNFPTSWDRKMEADRDAAKDIVAEHYPQVKVARKHHFEKINEFMKIADDLFENDIWVLKPMSDGAKTKVPDSGDPQTAKQEIIDAIESDPSGYESEGFELELMIPNVIEITPQKVYYDGKPLYVSLDIEAKRLGSAEGPMTGCAADLVFPIDMDSRIARIAFPKYVDGLAKQHRGLFIWDISLLINPSTGAIYMGEFCPNRPGYNAFYTELSLLEYITQWFEDVVAGKNPMNGAQKFGASVRMFQVKENGKKEGIGITLDDFKAPNIWIIDGKLGKDGGPETAGYIWDVGVATGSGSTPEIAAYEAYENAQGLLFDGKTMGRSRGDYLGTDSKDSIMMRYHYLIENKLI